jgi:YD repeat-containing protein
MREAAEITPALEAKAASFVKENRLVGAAVGVVQGDELIWSTGLGFADIGSRRATDAKTLHRIASITKTFTGTAILQLRDEGRLHLDDPAVEYLPELRAAHSPFGAIETVTIRRMLSHESGLVSEPPDTDWSTPAYQGIVAENLARADEIATTVPPSTQRKYSNLAFQFLGEIVTRVSGVPYVDYVRAQILDPLGMAGSGFEPLPDDLAARTATGYAARFLSDELDLASTPPTVWAEGGLWSCVDDLARWISFQFTEGTAPRGDAQILDGRTLAEMHTARYLGNAEWTEAWCIAWYAVRRGEVVWVQHSGGLHGFITNVCFDLKTKVGAIVLLNGVADAASLSMDVASIARDAVLAAPPSIEPPHAMPDAYRDLLGLYVDEETASVVRLEWRDGVLAFLDPSEPTWRPTLAATEEPDVFVVDPGTRESGETVRFRRDAEGRILSVFLAAGTFVRYRRADGGPG